jgi:hypothetical protein
MQRREQAPSGLRTSPTGRVPQWVLDEAVGRPVAPESWRSWSPVEPPKPRRRRNWTGIGGAVLVVAIVVIAAIGTQLGVLPGLPGLGSTASANGPDWPSPGGESSDEPLGTPMAVASGGNYAFLDVQADGTTPVAYDPCRPIHYVIRPDNAPVGGEQLIHEAVARVTEVTGLHFVYDGPTTEGTSEQRDLFQPDRYGDRWAPVLVTWDTEAEEPQFAGDVAGLGGSVAVAVVGTPRVYVTGTVALDAALFGEMQAWPEGWAIARAIVLHELGHVVGLAHVGDPAELMAGGAGGAYDFAAGDLSGLARLGAGECVPQV